jgi:hypothetical protein
VTLLSRLEKVALKGAHPYIGLFINTLPVRVQVDDASAVTGWLQSLQILQEFEHAARAVGNDDDR